jgi:hypothetical protein
MLLNLMRRRGMESKKTIKVFYPSLRYSYPLSHPFHLTPFLALDGVWTMDILNIWNLMIGPLVNFKIWRKACK